MGPGIKKIAVNLVSAHDLKQAHADIINYLYPDREAYLSDVRQNAIRIDYYVCHEHITADSTVEYNKNTTVHKTVPRGLQYQLESIRTQDNTSSVDQFQRLLNSLYCSWINSLKIQQQAQQHIYSLVINYSPLLAQHRARYAYSRNFITELDIFNTIIYEPRWLKIDYDCYVTSVYGFNKTVNFWRFMPSVTSDSLKHYNWHQSPQADQFVLPMWLNQQSLRVRSISEL